jgi:hypothetical protein
LFSYVPLCVVAATGQTVGSFFVGFQTNNVVVRSIDLPFLVGTIRCREWPGSPPPQKATVELAIRIAQYLPLRRGNLITGQAGRKLIRRITAMFWNCDQNAVSDAGNLLGSLTLFLMPLS